MNLAPLRQKPWMFFCLIAAACLGLYGKSLFFGFVWDDYAEIVMQDQFRQWHNFGDFFTTPYWLMATGGLAPYHRPMIPVMILMVSTFFGTHPFGYHLLNLILFTLTSWIYFLFLKQLRVSSWVSFLATAFFIAHPLHVEAVCWGSARPVLLSGLCFISILYFSNRTFSIHKPFKIAGRLLLLALIFAVGLNTYHSILTVILVLLAMDGMRLSPFTGQPVGATGRSPLQSRAMEYLTYIGLSVLCLSYFVYVIRSFDPSADLRPFYSPIAANVVYAGNPGEWLLTPLNTISRYTEILLFPLSLSPDYYFRATELSLSAMGALLLIIITTVLMTRDKDKKNLVLFSIVWMFLGLLTVANLLPQGGLFADRYAYIASMGFCLWLALIVGATGRSPLRMFTGMTILFLYILKTFLQADIWQNDFRFWLEATIASPHKARAHDKLGMMLQSMGRYEEAAKEYEKVLKLDEENFTMTRHRLAETYRKLGQK